MTGEFHCWLSVFTDSGVKYVDEHVVESFSEAVGWIHSHIRNKKEHEYRFKVDQIATVYEGGGFEV